MTRPVAHHPQRDAEALAGRPVRVLEPSPPADHDAPYFADDPATTDDPERVVTPTSIGRTTWSDLITGDAAPELVAYARDHWLAGHRPLTGVPDDYRSRRDDLHRLAYSVVAEARRQANTKFGLRYTHRGLGTPFFGDDVQVRLEAGHLVVQERDTARTAPITTLRAAGALAGVAPAAEAAEHDSPPLGDLDAPLRIDEELTDFFGDWFGFAASVLEELRLTPGAVDVSRTQIWPGHLDAAIEMGDADAGRRATYGASPGDADHPEPYLYVGPWGDIDRSLDFWNDRHFPGASLAYAELSSAGDQRTRALRFFGRAHTLLHP